MGGGGGEQKKSTKRKQNSERQKIKKGKSHDRQLPFSS